VGRGFRKRKRHSHKFVYGGARQRNLLKGRMSSIQSAQVASLFRYPVKGLTPEPLPRVALGIGETLPADRRYAIENGPSGFDPADPKWMSKAYFLMLMRDEWLAALHTHFDDASNVLTIRRNGAIAAQGDLETAQGRAAVRRYVGIARVAARPQPGRRVRGLVGHAARVANLPGRDCEVLAAAILDRLALTPWADVPMRAAPPVIARRAKLAAAVVHEPELLLIDGLLDGLGPRDTETVAASIRDLGRDTAIVAIGRDSAPLALACGEVLTLTDGIIVRDLAPGPPRLRACARARDPAGSALGWTR